MREARCRRAAAFWSNVAWQRSMNRRGDFIQGWWAEDHESIREIARQALVSLRYRVLCAADGIEALRLCEQQCPQIAVLDVVMPRMGGSETAAKLLERFPGLRVIFTSGYSRDR